MTFNNLNSAINKVHNAISHTKPIQPSSISEIQTAIVNHMLTYRKMFPLKVIPKQHILEKHCIPHIKQYKEGLGLLGEQGTKNSHQMISSIEKYRAHGITNDLKKLHHILTTHLLQVSPALRH